jgi:hypothetical protein
MGTHSLLAVETGPSKYHTQYMQFDGVPTWKGKEYYETILKSLMEGSIYFITNNKPNKNFFTRIKHFLDNAQYASFHSFNANQIMNAGEWDCDLWQYLFNKNGDFIFTPRNSSNYSCTIPWKFTLNLATHFARHDLNDDTLTPFWEFMENWGGTTNPPTLNLTTCETFAFPEQNDEGWRKSGTLTVMKNRIKTMFYDIQRKRNKQFTKPIYNSEYLTVKNYPVKKLPLLINSLKRIEAIDLLEKRLKRNF